MTMTNNETKKPMLSEDELLNNWQDVLNSIQVASQKANSAQQNVCLLAVSKTKPASMVAALAKAGQTNFGENYLQEAVEKIAGVNELLQAELSNNHLPQKKVVWHYIGHIQRNKTRDIANHFDWVHTIERDIIAKRLNTQRPDSLAKLNVLIQVNIDEEYSKSGCLPDAVAALVSSMVNYDRLCLRGLMIIPSKLEAGTNRSAFKRTKRLFDSVAATHPELTQWDTLSMGMSADLEDAIELGSTMVRVGSAIFGARE